MIYLIQNTTNSQIKIGRSKNPKRRLKTLQTGNGDRLKIIAQFDVEKDRHFEKRIHRAFWQFRKKGEWFEFPNKDVAIAIVNTIIKPHA